MEKQRRASESKLNGVPSKTYVFDEKSSRFLENFQELFHPSNDGVPFLIRKDSLDSSVGRHDEENQAETQRRVRLLSEEMLSTARKNSEMFHASSQYRTHETTSRTMPYVGEGYSFPSLPTICFLRGRDSNLLFPLSKYTPITEYNLPAKSEDPGNGGVHKEEFISIKSPTKPGTISEEREKHLKIKCASNKPHNSDEPTEKKRKEQVIQYSHPSNKTDERESYWERRRRNNASAKKSRDARRARELQTQIKVAFLEKENTRMLAELMAVRQENVCLRRVLSAKM